MAIGLRLDERVILFSSRSPAEILADASSRPFRELVMKVSVTCFRCGMDFKVDAQHAGKRGKCPNPDCSQVYIVPESDPEEDDAVPLPASSAKKTGRNQPQSLGWGESIRDKKPKSAKRTRSRFAALHRPSFLMGFSVSALLAVVVALLWPLVGAKRSSAAPHASADEFPSLVTPFMKKYCADCHSGDSPEAGVSFGKYSDEKAMLRDRRTWERSFNMISQGSMPPAESPQPPADVKSKLLDYLNEKLHHLDCSKVSDPGRVTIRRLNRSEYNNTVRDLMGVSFRPADDFPSDDVGYGFDNIGDVLSLPPLLMEKYLNAAEKITQEAILTFDGTNPHRHDFDQASLHRTGAAHTHGDDGIILVSNGEFTAEYECPKSGRYSLKVAAAETSAGNEPSKMEFRIDGKPVIQYAVSENEPKYGSYEFPIHLDRGPHKFAVAFLNDFYDPKAEDQKRRDRNLIVRDVQVIGPTEIDAAEYPAFHRSFLAVFPGEGKSLPDAARENLRPFIQRAFRRTATDEEINLFAGLAERIAAHGESFATAMQVAVTGVLVSPHFLFRLESDKNPNDANDRHPLGDHELATRLSYFLWSSMPDDELIAHADKGDLHTDLVIDEQVRRMLADPKSKALVDNFAEQWLQLRILNEITPDPKAFPEFNAELREDMKRETSRFFEHVMRADCSILDFLDGSYTFVNERLAKHYGLNGVQGNDFRQVSLAGIKRAGLLTQGSILTLTSNPDRTSPVKRGKWVMEVILNQPPPPPPPNVPELSETAKAQPNMTLRQQLELHRRNASCAACHRVMDQLGFGIENFDAIGRWRETDGNQPLDTRGELPGGGGTFNGPIELTGVLKQKQCEFGECLAEKMLTYALGRGLEFYDRCATGKIVKSLKEREFKFSVLVTEIVKSEPFRMRRGEEIN